MRTVRKSDYLQLNAIALPIIRECVDDGFVNEIALFELINIFYGSMKAKVSPSVLEDERLAELFELIKETHNKIIDTYMQMMKYGRFLAHMYLRFQIFKSYMKSVITLKLNGKNYAK